MKTTIAFVLFSLFTTAVVAQPSAVVRVWAQTGNQRAMGSGTVVEVADDTAVVVTAAHVIDSQDCTVKLTDGRLFKARVLGVDAAHDLALLLIRKPVGIVPISVATEPAVIGEPVQASGFGGKEVYKVNRGRTIRYVKARGQARNETLSISGPVRQGDSGGPMLNSKGQLVGVLWGCNSNATYGTYVHRVRWFMRRHGRHCGPPVVTAPKAEAPKAAKVTLTELYNRVSRISDTTGTKISVAESKRVCACLFDVLATYPPEVRAQIITDGIAKHQGEHDH